jgi:hypothetical protein
VPALPGPDRGGGPRVLGNVKSLSGGGGGGVSTFTAVGKGNKLTASEVLLQVKEGFPGFFFFASSVFLSLCMYLHTLYTGGGGLDGRGGVYLREYLSVALPFAGTRAAKGVPPFDS